MVQDREIRRVGSSEVNKIDIRIIATTNQDIDNSKRFRAELKNRFTYKFRLPTLSDRINDIPVLLSYMIDRNRGFQNSIEAMSLVTFLLYSWPENLRALKAIVELIATFDGGNLTFSNTLQAFHQYDVDNPLKDYKHLPDNLDALLGAPTYCPKIHPSTVAAYLLHKAEYHQKSAHGRNGSLPNTIPQELLKGLMVLNSIRSKGRNTPFFVNLSDSAQDKCIYPWEEPAEAELQSVVSMISSIAAYSEVFLSMWANPDDSANTLLYRAPETDNRLLEICDKQPSKAFIGWIEEMARNAPALTTLKNRQATNSLINSTGSKRPTSSQAAGNSASRRGPKNGPRVSDDLIVTTIREAVRNGSGWDQARTKIISQRTPSKLLHQKPESMIRHLRRRIKAGEISADVLNTFAQLLKTTPSTY